MNSNPSFAPGTDLVVVGAIARIDIDSRPAIVEALHALEGVETFDLPDEHQLGVLVEADSLDRAHARVTDDVRAVAGVRAVWPIAVELDTANQPENSETP